jgi:hypothetical protein
VGATLNFAGILIGALVGLLAGKILPERIKTGTPMAFGLICFGIGAALFVKVNGFLIVAISLAAGTLLGEWLDIDGWVQRGTHKMQKLFTRFSFGNMPEDKREKFASTFATLLVLFCMGPVALVGGLREGLTGDFSILAAKAVLDMVTIAMFATTLGIGSFVLAFPVLLVEVLYTVGAGALSSLLTERMIIEISACGGIIMFGTGLRILELKQVRTLNMLPSLVLAPFVTLLVVGI